MTAQQHHKFEQTENEIHRRFGNDALQILGHREKNKPFPTGFPELDLLVKGIPSQAITLLRGVPTAGIATIAYHIMAQAQQQGNVVAYIDCAETFDGQYATQNCGVDENRLIHIEPGDAINGVAITRDLLPLRYRGLIVLDMGLLEPVNHALTDTLSNMMRTISLLVKHSTSTWTSILLLPAKMLPALNAFASLILTCNWEGWIEKYGVTSGYRTRVTVTKHPQLAAGVSVSIAIKRDGAIP
jgi:hypothetical protein